MPTHFPTPLSTPHSTQLSANKQRGFVTLLILLLALVIGGGLLVNSINSSTVQRVDRDAETDKSLAAAKAALTAYVLANPLELKPAITGPNTAVDRPGDLPCPDLNNDGAAETSCTTTDSRLGRLPWRTLGLPDLRDASGERLWYALSNDFRRSNLARSPDTLGKIGFASTLANVDLSTPNNFAIAIIFAPGRAVDRNGIIQTRVCAAGDCDARGICISTPVKSAAACNPANYLDIDGQNDNAIYTENPTGSIQKFLELKPAGSPTHNDRAMVITRTEMLKLMQTRVANEVLVCAKLSGVPLPMGSYFNAGKTSWTYMNTDRTPNASGDWGDTREEAGKLNGRFPNAYLLPLPPPCAMSETSYWWEHWKEYVFYSVAPQVARATPLSCGDTPNPSTCLSVDGGITFDRDIVVLVAGAAAGRPLRSDRSTAALTYRSSVANYLDAFNLNSFNLGTRVFKQDNTPGIHIDSLPKRVPPRG